MNLPSAFEEKMKKLLGSEYETYLSCYEEPRYYGLRVNTNKISSEDFAKIAPFSIRPIPWIENGFYYDGEQIQPAKASVLFRRALLSAGAKRDDAWQTVCLVEPGDRVLDVCAAPGGKATELGAKLSGEGVLVANDISNSQCKGTP